MPTRILNFTLDINYDSLTTVSDIWLWIVMVVSVVREVLGLSLVVMNLCVMSRILINYDV